ncbi:hypothetical protein LINPERPRIM_LOCUS11297 [Linum perenne]
MEKEEDRCRRRDLKLKDGGAVRKESSWTADPKTYLSPSMQPPDLGLRGRWDAQAETPSQISTWAKVSNQEPCKTIKGSIISKNPKAMVSDIKLGDGFYEIFVEVAIKLDEPLVQPYGSFSVIGNVTEVTISWSLLSRAEEERLKRRRLSPFHDGKSLL